MLKKVNNLLIRLIEHISFWLKVSRAFSLPTSFCVWTVPFVFGIFHAGNIPYGLLALIGIVFAHLGVNMTDDFSDYKYHLANKNELYEGKCWYLRDNSITMEVLYNAIFICFAIAFLIGYYFFLKYGLIIVLISVFTAILCLSYSKISFYGLGEVVIGILFGPVLFFGVYFVMTGNYSSILMILSIPSGFLAMALSLMHGFMDYERDMKIDKKTIWTVFFKKLKPKTFEQKEFQANLIKTQNVLLGYTALVNLIFLIYYLC